MLAQHFFLGVAQFNRIFKEATGTTPQHYINAKRLISAKEKIKGGMPVCEVAAPCGFSDYSSFYRAYKKYFPMHPPKLRHNLKEPETQTLLFLTFSAIPIYNGYICMI